MTKTHALIVHVFLCICRYSVFLFLLIWTHFSKLVIFKTERNINKEISSSISCLFLQVHIWCDALFLGPVVTSEPTAPVIFIEVVYS